MANEQEALTLESGSIDANLVNAVDSALPFGAIFEYGLLIRRAMEKASLKNRGITRDMVERIVSLMAEQNLFSYTTVGRDKLTYISRGSNYLFNYNR